LGWEMNVHRFLLFAFAILLFLLTACGGGDSDEDSGDDGVDDDDDSADDDDDDDDDNDDNDDDTVEGPYYQDFLHYWQTMDEGYAYFIEKGVDWDQVYTDYEQQSFSETDLADFSLMIAQITASLGDSHTAADLSGVPVEKMPFRYGTGVCLHRVGSSAYVSRLSDDAETGGLLLGDEVTALDGEAVDTVLARAVGWEGCSSTQCCDYWRLPRVDRFAAGEDEVVYTVQRAKGPVDITVERDSGYGGTCKPQPLLDFLAGTSGWILRYKKATADIGYIFLDTLSDNYSSAILDDLELALTEFAGLDGLIFDARYNHGGSDLVAMKVLAKFLSQIVVPVTFRYKNGPAHDDFTAWLPEPVLPGLTPTAIPVVFLVNGGCVSAADFFSAAASYVPTFTLMGTTTCGGTGAPDSDTLPISGITYWYSQMQRKYLATGEQIEGNGIAPDEVVELSPGDLALGIDTQIQAAIDWLTP
jgi:C-terminal processing protease CtpA/Prc